MKQMTRLFNERLPPEGSREEKEVYGRVVTFKWLRQLSLNKYLIS